MKYLTFLFSLFIFPGSFFLSAEKNYHWGLYNLANMYDTGKGVAQNATEAVQWYERAAKKGNSTAQYQLGLKYKEGSGIGQSDVYAHMWLNISSIKGYKEASKALNKLENIMSAPAIGFALKLGDVCKNSKYKNCTIDN